MVNRLKYGGYRVLESLLLLFKASHFTGQFNVIPRILA